MNTNSKISARRAGFANRWRCLGIFNDDCYKTSSDVSTITANMAALMSIALRNYGKGKAFTMLSYC